MISKIQELKEYMEKYGELDMLSDLSIIFSNLETDWKLSNQYKRIGYCFGDAANLIAQAQNTLKVAQITYSQDKHA